MTDPVSAPEKVTVINPDGRLVRIAASDLDRALQQGYHPASAGDAPQAEKPVPGYDELVAKGANPAFAAFAQLPFPGGAPSMALQQGAISGATAGLGNIAEAKAAGALAPLTGLNVNGEAAVKKGIRDLQETYPDTFQAGEVGGMLAATAVGGAAGRLAPLARAALPTAAIDAVGAGVGGAATRGLAGIAAKGTLGRAAAAGLELGARGAAENALYGAAHEWSEEMLGDHDANAEKIFAAAMHQGAIGALIGGGLGATGSAAKSGYQGLKGLISETAAAHADDLEKLAAQQRWKALDPLKKYSKEAEARVPGGMKSVGEVLKRYGVVAEDLQQAASQDIDDVLARADAAKTEVGQRIGDIQASSPATVKYGKVVDILDGVIDPLRKGAGLEDVVGSLDRYKASLASKLGIDDELDAFIRARNMGQPIDMAGAVTERESRLMSDAWKAIREKEIPVQDVIAQRKVLDDIVYGEARALDPKMRVAMLRQIRGGIEGSVVDAIDEAASRAGRAETRAEYLGLKRDYQALSLATDAATDSAARSATNRNLSWSDYMSGGAASHVGSTVGGIIGGGPGAMVGGLAGGALGAAGNRFMRGHGNALTAMALDKLAAYGRVAQAARLADEQIKATAKSLVEGIDAMAAKPATKTSKAAETIRFAPHEKTAAHETTVMVNADALDRAWSRSTSYYIPSGGGGAEILGRRQNFSKFLEKKQPVQASRVTFVPETGEASFIDGRHRFSVLRDRGQQRVAITIAKDEVKTLPRDWGAVRLTEEQARTARLLPLRDRYAAARDQVQRITQDPQRLVERLSVPSTHLPQTSASLANTAMRAVTSLAASAPPPVGRPVLGQPMPKYATDADMFRYVDRHQATLDPLQAFAELGIAPRKELAMRLQEVTPAMFSELQQECVQMVIDRQAAGKPVPFEARQRMHLLLGIITDPSQDPKMMRSLQANLADEPGTGQNQASPSGPAPRPVDLQTQQSAFDRLEER